MQPATAELRHVQLPTFLLLVSVLEGVESLVGVLRVVALALEVARGEAVPRRLLLDPLHLRVAPHGGTQPLLLLLHALVPELSRQMNIYVFPS